MNSQIFNLCDPICIKLLDLDNKNEYYIKQFLIIVGDIPDDIKTEINKVKDTLTKSNKKLEKYYGSDWFTKLYFDKCQKLKSGGDNIPSYDWNAEDDWDDINDNDFSNMLHAYTNRRDYYSNTIVRKKIQNTLISKIDFIFNISIYNEDSIEDFKEKIQVITKIPYYKQYISNDDRSVGYNLEFNTGVDVDILYPNILELDFENIINDVPINITYYDMKDNINVIATDIKTNMNSFSINNQLEFILISLDSYINDKNSLLFLAKSDQNSYDIIYYSFIVIFFPLISYNVFSLYLISENEIALQYPDIGLNISEYKQKINETQKLINNINNLKTSSKSYLINTKDLVVSFPGYNNKILSTKYLFDNIQIDKFLTVNFIEALINISGNYTYIKKINHVISRDNNKRNINLELNQICINCFSTNQANVLTITINEYGYVSIYASTRNDIILTKEDFIKYIALDVNKILEKINNLGSSVFYTSQNLQLVDTNNKYYSLSQTSLGIMFNTQYNYEHFINLIDSLLSTSMFRYAKNDKSKNGYYYILKHNITSYSDNMIKYINKESSNQFEYLTDERKKNNMQIVFDSKKIYIQHVRNFLSIDLLNLSKEESNFYVEFVTRFVEFNSAKLNITDSISDKLKLTDPILFNYSEGVRYPRVCQKKLQPVITTKNDKKAVKYKNWTYDRDEYYKCPDKIYNYLGMIVGHHPEGYCLPCCRKKPSDTNIIKQCIANNHQESQITDRTYIQYIMDYPNSSVQNNKIVDRKMYLPNYLQTLINNTKLMVNGIFRSSENYPEDGSYDMIDIYAKYLNISNKNFLLLINEFLIQHPSVFRSLLNYNILDYFPTQKLLLDAMNNKYLQGKKILILSNKTITSYNKMIIEFDWNSIFIDIMYKYGIQVILFTDYRNDSTNININLEKMDNLMDGLPTILVVKRYNTEYYNDYNQHLFNYLPITDVSTGIKKDKEISISIIDTDTYNNIKKLYTISNQKFIYYSIKQFRLANILKFIKNTKSKNTYQIKNVFINDHNINNCIRLSVNKNDFIIFIYQDQFNKELDSKHVINSNVDTINYNNLGNLENLLSFLEDYNSLNNFDDVNLEYIDIYYKREKNFNFNLGTYDKYIIKIDKFILFNNNVIGAILCTISNNQIISKYNCYFKHEKVSNIFRLINDYKLPLVNTLKNLTQKNIHKLITNPINFNYISNSIIYNSKLDLKEYKNYFIELLLDPTNLKIKDNLDLYNINAYKEGIYNRYIYKLLLHDLISELRLIQVKDFRDILIKELSKLSLQDLKNLSTNDITLCKETIIKSLGKLYNHELLELNVDSTIQYVKTILNPTDKNFKTKYIDILKNNKLPCDSLYIDNLMLIQKEELKKLIEPIIKSKITLVDNINYKSDIDLNFNHTNKFFYTKDKLIILKSLYPHIVDIIASDLSNPFKKKYLYNDIEFTNIINNSNFNYHKNELIYLSNIQ